MRKLITLLAAATLAASPFAFAEEQNGNPNDVLQTVPGQSNASAENNLTVAENNDAAPVAPEEQAAKQAAADKESASAPEAKPAKKHHHKHHAKKHKKHHRHHAKKAAESTETTTKTETTTAPTEAPSQPAASTETPAQ